jgi:HSP20 family molecular chaperone IbpA
VPIRWPIDVSGATAELSKGVLVVQLPKLKDRRGTEIPIPVTEKAD